MLICFLLGAIIGGLISSIIFSTTPVGTLRIDNSDPDEPPYLFLELGKGQDPDSLMQQKYVSFKVNPKSYISQK